MSPSDRSPLHPKALTLDEFRRIPRGNTILVCRHDARSFVAADAVRSFGIVEVREGEWREWVVIDSLPSELRGTVRQLTPFGVRVSVPYYPGIPVARIPYRRPRLTKGYAFPLSMLGLRPGLYNRWSRHWLMRVSDM